MTDEQQVKVIKKNGTTLNLLLQYFYLWMTMPLVLQPMVYIFFNVTRFARASNQVSDFNYLNKSLTAKLLKQGYRCHKLGKKKEENSPGSATITKPYLD